MGWQSYECDLGPLMRTHVKMRYQETLARFSLTFLVEFCKLLSDLRDRRSHLLDGIKQREHRAYREHTLHRTASASKGRGRGKKFCQSLRSCFGANSNKTFVLNTNCSNIIGDYTYSMSMERRRELKKNKEEEKKNKKRR